MPGLRLPQAAEEGSNDVKPFIPYPLGVDPRRVVPVFIVDASAPVVSGATSRDAAVCRARWELGHLATDLVTVTSPRWLAFAVSEALAGRLPRTQCYLAPVLSLRLTHRGGPVEARA